MPRAEELVAKLSSAEVARQAILALARLGE